MLVKSVFIIGGMITVVLSLWRFYKISLSPKEQVQYLAACVGFGRNTMLMEKATRYNKETPSLVLGVLLGIVLLLLEGGLMLASFLIRACWG